MKVILTYILLILISINTGIAQQSIGFSGGVNKGLNSIFSKKNANDFSLKNGTSFSSSYETKLDSISNLKVELQYQIQNAVFTVENNIGKTSSYKKIDYLFQLVNLNTLYFLPLVKTKKTETRFLIGPSFSYNLNTRAEGNGWEFYYKTQIDTNGSSIYILTTRSWNTNENSSKDLSLFNVMLNLGFDFKTPICKRLNIIFQNKYTVYLTNVLLLDDYKRKRLFMGYATLGLQYEI